MRLSDSFHSLRSSHDDWSEILCNPSYFSKDHKISWWGNNDNKFSPNPVHKSYVLSLIKNHQYTSKIILDDSIIQIFYEYERNDENLLFAKLAYFNSGISDEEILDDFSALSGDSAPVVELYPGFSNIDPINYDDPLVPWIRVDYDLKRSRSPLHHTCHMHIGLFRHARIPLSRVPSPRQFIEFIISLCYPEQYKLKRLDDKGNPIDLKKICSLNRDAFDYIEDTVYDMIPHLHIPKHI